jgi:hypothetical protein
MASMGRTIRDFSMQFIEQGELTVVKVLDNFRRAAQVDK